LVKFRVLFCALLFSANLVAETPQRPNILVLMAEDMSARVGAFGDAVAVTPNIDALARQGVRYPNTFTAAGVCAPSRAAHILGMHQISTGTQHMRTSTRIGGGYYAVPPPEAKAYPELLRAAGYYTFTDGKLDYQFSGIRSGSGPSTIWDAEGMTDWRGKKEGQPFYGLINFQETHESGIFQPLGNMPNSRSHFMLQVFRWWGLESIETGVVDPKDIVLEPYYPDTPTVRTDIARHYDNIAGMDAQVGRILAMLEEDGLADSTIVIWTTDHGDGLPRAKRELFDSGIKVPMIIYWPQAYRPADAIPGKADTRLISFIDLAPTVLRLAGVSAPDNFQGGDFLSSTTEPRSYIYASRDRIDEVPDRQRAVRDHRFKYIRSWHPDLPGGHPLAFRDNMDMSREMQSLYRDGKLNKAQSQWFEPPGQERLFDLKQDPFELNDVSKDPAYKQELVRMRGALDSWLADVKDWGDEDEITMIEQFAPGAVQITTPAPDASIADGVLTVSDVATGASVGYRVDGRAWKLYSEKVKLTSADKVEVKAVRYGWKESDIIVAGPEPR
jgi:N-sulfoglucosamine sulfohydrolase